MNSESAAHGSNRDFSTREPVAALLLGAGLGTRMKSDKPKVLHEVAGRPMVAHVLSAVSALSPELAAVVVGPGLEDEVGGAVAPTPVVVQEERLGTADAVKAGRDLLSKVARGTVLVLFGDTPFVRPETLARAVEIRENGAAVVVFGFRADDPTNYGRLVLDEDGSLARIVEHRDASEEERRIDLCNGGAMAIDASRFFQLVDRIGNDNAKGEYYLTDIVGLARQDGLECAVVEVAEDELLGVDSKVDLAAAETRWQQARRRHAMAEEGAILLDPNSVWFSYDTVLGRDVKVGQNTVFGPGVTVRESVEIKPFCHLEGCTVHAGAVVGPYARLRPGTEIGEGARVGNFVEIKNATLHEGAKANHLSYIGDADVGASANIGAGTITCNYDGYLKHRTRIGAGAFIGSNSALVAPVDIGEGAIVGAGSTVTSDVEENSIAVARGEQVQRSGAAVQFRETKAAQKKKRDANKDEG